LVSRKKRHKQILHHLN